MVEYLIAWTLQVRLAATSCVTKDITEPGDYGGFPAVSAIFVLSSEILFMHCVPKIM